MNGKEALDLLRGGLVLLLEKANQEEQTDYIKGMVSGINASMDVADLMLKKPLTRL
jgi:hypothetical protein